MSRSTFTRLRTKLLLSYLVVVAVSIGVVVLSVELIGPSLFDRLLSRHMHGGGMGGQMTQAMRDDTVMIFRDAVWQTLLLATLAATLAALVISAFVSRRVTAPIGRMAAMSQRIAGGDYRARAPVSERDELGELAASLNSMAAALEGVEQQRVQLIADVAHEIRTPLATLRGNLEGLLDGVIAPSSELWAQLYDETTRINRLVDDLRELSLVASGQVSLRPQPVAPRRLVDAALARLAPHFEAKGVALTADVADGVPPVMADEDRALQVLTNLLTNALRHTPAGGRVEVSAVSDASAVRFAVRDTGSGIPAEHLPRIFDRFYRVDPARARSGGGSGIGLTIARALVEAHGGRIWAESPGPGQGSTFTFTLPRPSAPSPFLIHS